MSLPLMMRLPEVAYAALSLRPPEQLRPELSTCMCTALTMSSADVLLIPVVALRRPPNVTFTVWRATAHLELPLMSRDASRRAASCKLDSLSLTRPRPSAQPIKTKHPIRAVHS